MIKFRCGCGGTVLEEVKVGVTVINDIVAFYPEAEVPEGESCLEYGDRRDAKGGSVSHYRCRECHAAVADDYVRVIQDERTLVAFLASRNYNQGTPATGKVEFLVALHMSDDKNDNEENIDKVTKIVGFEYDDVTEWEESRTIDITFHLSSDVADEMDGRLQNLECVKGCNVGDAVEDEEDDEVVYCRADTGQYFREPDNWVTNWRHATSYTSTELNSFLDLPDLLPRDVPTERRNVVALAELDAQPDEPDYVGFNRQVAMSLVREQFASPNHKPIPPDFPVQPLQPGQDAENPRDKATCGHCGLSWDDGQSTSWTPAPSGRCPFEYFHIYPEDAKPVKTDPWQRTVSLASLLETANELKSGGENKQYDRALVELVADVAGMGNIAVAKKLGINLI